MAELNQQHRSLVVARHGLRLIVEAPAVEGSDQVVEALALHTDVRCQDVVPYLYCDRLHTDAPPMNERRQVTAKFPEVHDDLGRSHDFGECNPLAAKA